ncbi:MAG TPA: hypothetical protein PLQ67_02085, partial [Burkholderiaceae bacterium]|nr:hypothetical protein [Burkholderiaceae bacterium]
YVLLGTAPVNVQRVGPYRLSYLRWAKGNSAELGALERAHAQALVRFARTTEQPLPRAVVLWLPIDARQGSASAVSSALVAIGNAPSDPTGTLAAGLPYALATLLHAQFAQMLGERLPPWVRISLAEYGARKALPLSGLDAQTLARIEAGYPDPQQGPSQSLLQAQAQLKDPATSARAYTQLMLEGANFWLALDRAIQVHSNDQQSLEDALPAIVAARYDSDTALPLPLAQRLQRMAGAQAFNALLQRYVGLAP